jgi:Flp pilus assembly secretin CpaC
MNRLLLVVALVAVPLSVLGAAPKVTVVAVPLGKVKVVPAAGFDRVALDDPQLAAVVPRNDRELAITGLKDGTTTLWVYKKEGNPVAYQLKVGSGQAAAEAAVTGDDGGVPALWAKPIELAVGAEMLVRTSALEGLAVVDPEVAEVRVLSDVLVVVRGLSPGSTHALIYPRGGGMPTRYPVTVKGPPQGPDGGV